MSLRFTTVLLITALLSAISAGCVGKAPAPPAPQLPAASQPPAGAFPAPSALLAREHGVSYVQADLGKVGSGYSNLIPPNRSQNSGDDLIMSPAVFPGKLSDINKAAYALYDFTLNAYDLDPVFGIDWLRPPAGAGVVYAGFANFNTDRWDWYSTTPGQLLTLPAFTPYIHSGTNRMLVVVLATGFADVTVNNVRVGLKYDEFETGDTDGINILPDADFSGYTGSVGTGLGYPGYNGDTTDKYAIYVKPGDTLNLTLNYNDSNGALSMSLEDGLNTPLGSVSGPSPLIFVRSFVPSDTPPYFLTVKADSGFSDYTLSKTIQHAPDPRLKADQWHGSAPLLVNFDASGSTDEDGTIVKYEWDWDGNGTFDQDSGTNPIVAHTFSADGNYRATVRVTDNDARQAELATTVTVGSMTYDEIENNDLRYKLTKLPAVPFTDYRGSIGTSGGYPGYDGDNADGYSFYPSLGQKITFTITYDPLTAPDMQILSADSGLATIVTGNNIAAGVQTISVTRSVVDRLPYILEVDTQSGYGDYTLSAAGGLAPRPSLNADHDAGDAPLDVSFDAGESADNGSIVKYQWDWNGDFTFDQNTGALPFVVHSFATPGNYMVHLLLTDDKGLQAGLTKTIYAWPTHYDEVEPNNDMLKAPVSLPPLPVSGFKGNLGSSVGYAGYDGGNSDQFLIPGLKSGDTVTITVTSDASTANMDVKLHSIDNISGYGNSSTDSGTEQVVRTLDGSEKLPLVLDLQVGNGDFTDYTLDVSKS